jgi:hypothetical protein
MRKRGNTGEIPDDDIVVTDDAPEIEVLAEPEHGPDPLDVLRREVNEHKSARADAERKLADEKAERERVSGEHATSRLAQDRTVIEQAYSAAEARSATAKRAFTDAMKAGDFTAAADAQAAIARVENEMQRYADAYQVIEERSKAPQPAAPPAAESVDAQIARIPDPAVRQWATDHREDLADPARLKLAYAADNLAVARGLMPGTDAYFDFMDDQLGYEMDEQTAPPPPPRPASVPARRRTPPVAAPVSRGGGGKVSVTLSDTDKAFAGQLGMSHKDYARSIVAAKADPRFDKYSNRSR